MQTYKARGKRCSFVNGFLGAALLNLSRCIEEGGGGGFGVGADLQSRMRGVSLVDTSSDEEEVGSSLFPVKENAYSLSPIFGLALVALVVTHWGMDEQRTDAHGSATG